MLGASNLTRGISTVVSWLRGNLGGPFDLYVAFGYGRSFGIKSGVFGRDLPSIKDCGIWEALAARPPHERDAPTYALITDIGNDLLYQVPPDEIARWLEYALRKFRELGAKISIVQIPKANVEKVTRLQFFLLNRIFFPGRNMQPDDMRARAMRLAAHVERLAREYGATLVDQKPEWYGFDPIHYKIWWWPRAWASVLGSWQETALVPVAAFRQWLYLRSRGPAQRWFFGREQRYAQPHGRLSDGSTVHVY